jgi:hypothetical protein
MSAAAAPDKTVIDVQALREKYKDDSLSYHLWTVALDCKRRRDAFWRYSSSMKAYNNAVSVPLLLLTSATGLTSMANLSNPVQGIIPVLIAIFGVSGATLTALQRYFRFGERSEHGKHMAKSYARIAKRIEDTMAYVDSKVATMDNETFTKFLGDIQKEQDTLLQEMEELPRELMNEKSIYDRIMRGWWSAFFSKKEKKDNGEGAADNGKGAADKPKGATEGTEEDAKKPLDDAIKYAALQLEYIHQEIERGKIELTEIQDAVRMCSKSMGVDN